MVTARVISQGKASKRERAPMGFENETRCTTNEARACPGRTPCVSRNALSRSDAKVSTERERASPSDACRSFEEMTFESRRAAGNRPRSKGSLDRFAITFPRRGDGHARPLLLLPDRRVRVLHAPTQEGAKPRLRHGTASKST